MYFSFRSRQGGRDDLGVGALVHDVYDTFSESPPDLLPCHLASPVFDDVVQQGRDGRLLVAPFSRTIAATAIRWEMYGICVPLRR